MADEIEIQAGAPAAVEGGDAAPTEGRGPRGGRGRGGGGRDRGDRPRREGGGEGGGQKATEDAE